MRLSWGATSGLVLGLMAVGGIAGGATSYLIPERWESKGIVEIRSAAGFQAMVESLEKSRSDVTSRRSLVNLITDARLHLYGDQRRTEPLEDIEDTMRSAIHVGVAAKGAAEDGAAVFSVGFRYTDPAKARDTTNALLVRMTQELKASNPDYRVEVLDSPTLPREPLSPKRTACMAMGLLAGLVLALAVILLVRRRMGPPGPGLQAA